MFYTYLSKFKWNRYLFCYFLFNVIESVLSKQKIAIIGAGIGGTSCAYFLNELLGNDVEITVFEESEIGGRLATVKYDSAEYEIGGTSIHPHNKYMSHFANSFGLKRKSVEPHGQMIIANGKQSVFKTSKWNIITLIKAFFRYWWALFRLPGFINNVLNSFKEIYEQQSLGTSFKTVQELLYAMDPMFPTFQRITSHEGFKQYTAVNEKTILEFIQAALRVNYGQTIAAPMLVGAVSVSCAIEGEWSVEGGNKRIAENCLKESKAKLYNYKVNQIIRNEKEDKFNIVVESNGETEIPLEYDIVVIATPITADMKSKIEFIGFQNPIQVEGRYHKTVVTILKGNLKSTFLDQKSVDHVGSIINLDEDEPYFMISKIKPIHEENSLKNDNIWKIHSQHELSDSEIDDQFNDAQKITVVNWLAYPQYEQLNREDSFILDHKLYYINAIEWAASTIEMSVISAKNVALLIHKHVKETK